jgi:hypothetical protein
MGGGPGSGGAGSGGSGTGGTTLIDPDLVLWYTFDESSGTSVTDSSGHARTGTLANVGSGTAALSSTHRVGTGSVNMTGQGTAGGGYVAVPASLQAMGASTAVTIACWVNWRTDQIWERVFDFGSTGQYGPAYAFLSPHGVPAGPAQGTSEGVFFKISAQGQFYEQVIVSPSVLSLNAWHHVAVVLQSGSPYVGTLYVDGAAGGANPAMTLHPSDLGETPNNWLGRGTYSFADPYLDGMLDDFRVYKRALALSEIAALYTGGSSGTGGSGAGADNAGTGGRGAGGASSVGVGGTGGGGADTGGSGTGGTCVEPSVADCRQGGTPLLTAQYWCSDLGSTTPNGDGGTGWGTCGPDGKLVGYYAGLPCPFDVGIAHTSGWSGPCPECLNGAIITNGGLSTSAAWQNTAETRYCCAGSIVKKIARCR